MMQPGSSKATIYDVAKESGVSIGTVSRVMNNRKDVAPATRKRVLDAAKRIGFMPQITVRRVSIGLVIQEIETIHEVGYVGAVLSELANHSARCGAVLEIVPLNDLDRIHRHYLQGVIGLLFGDTAKKLRDVRHIPVFLINNMAEKERFHTVATDHAEGARMGTEHLLRHGHRRIAFVQIEEKDWGAKERERGFREAFKAAKVPVPTDLITYLESWSIEQAFDPLFRRKPTAILVSGEDLSIAITEALTHRLKIRIPEDISLVTYEVPLMSKLFMPPQTTIAQPWAQMARTAMDGLLAAIARKTTGLQHILLPNQLIERASVRDLR
jgi:LacI family transcriptional regulator